MSSAPANDYDRATYLSNVHYDAFGRPVRIEHGDGTVDERAYEEAGKNFRLKQVTAKRTAVNPATLFDYGYDQYTPTGMVAAVADRTPLQGPGQILNNGGVWSYDGLGRLTKVANNTLLDSTYAHDSVGNLTRNADRTFLYGSTTQPHTPATMIAGAAATALDHDDNGNRESEGPGRTFAFDPYDRLTRVTVGAETVDFVYDAAGQRVAKQVGGVRTYYFAGGLVEHADGWMTKHYVANGMVVALRRDRSLPWWARGLAAVSLAAAVVTADLTPNLGPVLRGISTPYGRAIQSASDAALEARQAVEQGRLLYRGGRFGRGQAAEAQFWSLENPLGAGYTRRYGIPPENVNFDFVLTGRLEPGAAFAPMEECGAKPGLSPCPRPPAADGSMRTAPLIHSGRRGNVPVRDGETKASRCHSADPVSAPGGGVASNAQRGLASCGCLVRL
jgi:hypothetical protein